ncbi:MAG: hypothetical protein R6W78_04025 [Bacteroidales bacterium]
MKNRAIILFIALLAGIIAFYSCTKEDRDNTLDLLLNNTWVYDSLAVSDPENSMLMIAATFTHLGFKGNEYDFSSDGNYTVKSDMLNEGGIWELSENKLIMDKGTEDEMELEILAINSSIVEFKLPMEGEIFSVPFSGYVILKFQTK